MIKPTSKKRKAVDTIPAGTKENFVLPVDVASEHKRILREQDRNIEEIYNMPCPLAASNPKAWKEYYRNDELPIPKRRYKQISKLEKIVGQIYQNETKCQKALRPFFAFLFNGIRPVSIVTDNSAIVDDVLLTDNTDFGEKAAPVIWEYKNEIGTGGKDPTIQGGCEYAKYWAQTDIVKHRKYSCCPSIVLAIAGPWICVLRAIYLEKPVIELLTDFILMMNRPEDDGIRVKQLATLFEALRLAYQTLDDFYKNLSKFKVKKIQKFFPYCDHYQIHGNEIKFIYLYKLTEDPKDFVWKAKTEGDEIIFVKFTKKTNNLLDEKRFAQRWLYADDESSKDWRMIIYQSSDVV
ncbi:9041_t:CDS:2 [Entrophospora sp. SA101]|nr:9041_t:CDS:2 [Entrophospora sp. SA101]